MTLTAGELAQARTDAAILLSSSCAIRRMTRTPNDSGGYTETETTVATVGCRIGQPSGREFIAGGKTAEESDAIVHMPALTDIRGTDRILVGGVTYEVSGPPVAVTDEILRSVFVSVVA